MKYLMQSEEFKSQGKLGQVLYSNLLSLPILLALGFLTNEFSNLSTEK
jgi:hypothetical protein